MKGKLIDLKEYFENQNKVLGKLLTVQYFELTPDGIPRFPVGASIRDYE
jgi:DNA ligase-1